MAKYDEYDQWEIAEATRPSRIKAKKAIEDSKAARAQAKAMRDTAQSVRQRIGVLKSALDGVESDEYDIDKTRMQATEELLGELGIKLVPKANPNAALNSTTP